MHGEQRLIIATCEKGTVEDVNDMKDIKAGLDKIKAAHPNFVDMAAQEVFRPVNPKSVADPLPTQGWRDGPKGAQGTPRADGEAARSFASAFRAC